MFAVAWLGLALQPCAMAAAEGAGCPGCPPGMSHPGMDHPGMDHPGMDHPGMDHPGMDHDGMSRHAAPDVAAAAAACGADAADCLRGDVYSHDVRGGKVPLKQASGDAPEDGADNGTGQAAVAILDTARRPHGIGRDRLPDAVRGQCIDPAAAPPRNVLFCVYLK